MASAASHLYSVISQNSVPMTSKQDQPLLPSRKVTVVCDLEKMGMSTMSVF